MIDRFKFDLQALLMENDVQGAAIGNPREMWKGHESFQIPLPNGWIVKCGYGKVHRSDGETTVEVSLLKPNGAMFTARTKGTEYGVWPERTVEQTFAILKWAMTKE